MLLKKCDLCGKNEFSQIERADDKMFNIPGDFTVVRCKNCGLSFINPQPDAKALSEHYPKEDYYSLKENSMESKKLFLYRIFYSPGNYLLKALLSPLKPFVRSLKLVNNGNILDIGCGDGKFLRIAKNLGMNAYGVEPNLQKDVNSDGIKIYSTTLDKAKFKKEFFDTVTMNHVLEHVDRPSEIFSEISRITKKGGTFIVATPNIGSLTYRIFRSNWVQLDSPRHLFLFSEKTLRKYLEMNGFKVKKMIYNSTPLQFSGSIIYSAGSLLRKRFYLSESKLNSSTILFAMLMPLAYLFNFLRIGDQIEVIAEKI